MPWEAAANLIGTGISSITTGVQNRKNREFTAKQNQINREEAWRKWVAQNNYNRPSEQMKRFKEAGLNPNLIYGQGNSGSASPVPSSSSSQPNFQPLPDLSEIGSSTFGAYANTLQQRLSREQTQANIALIRANELKALSETDTKSYDLTQKRKHQQNIDALLQDKTDTSKIDLTLKNQQLNTQEATLNYFRSKKSTLGEQKAKQLEAATNKTFAEINALHDAAALKDFKVALNKLLMSGATPTINKINQIANRIKSQYK